MTAKAVQVAVSHTTAATLLNGLGFSDSIPGLAGEAQNTGSHTVYIGGSDVDTTTHGYPIVAGAKFRFVVEPSDEIYMICAGTDTSTISVFMLGV